MTVKLDRANQRLLIAPVAPNVKTVEEANAYLAAHGLTLIPIFRERDLLNAPLGFLPEPYHWVLAYRNGHIHGQGPTWEWVWAEALKVSPW